MSGSPTGLPFLRDLGYECTIRCDTLIPVDVAKVIFLLSAQALQVWETEVASTSPQSTHTHTHTHTHTNTHTVQYIPTPHYLPF